MAAMTRVHESFHRLEEDAGMAVWWSEYCDGEGSSFVVQYQLQGEDGGTWHVAVDSLPPCCIMHEGPAEDPDLTLMLSDVDWLDVVTGRSSVWSLLASGRITAEGEQLLIGDLNLLGLLGPPVTQPEFAACSRAPWVFRPHPTDYPSDALWVVPRVLTAGEIDYDKWRYFAGRGDLQAEISKRIPWGVLCGPVAAPYVKTLRTVLRPLYWRYTLLRGLSHNPIARFITAATVILVAIAALILVSWKLLLPVLAVTVVAGYVLDPLDPFDGKYRRAREVLGHLAREDPEFFKLAIDSALMQIGQSRGFK